MRRQVMWTGNIICFNFSSNYRQAIYNNFYATLYIVVQFYLSLNFIFLCFVKWQSMIMSLKQKK